MFTLSKNVSIMIHHNVVDYYCNDYFNKNEKHIVHRFECCRKLCHNLIDRLTFVLKDVSSFSKLISKENTKN